MQLGEIWAAGTAARRAHRASQAAHKKQRHPSLPVKQWGTGPGMAAHTAWGERPKQISQSPVSSWVAGGGLTWASGRGAGMGQRVGFSSILCCCGLLLIQARPPDHRPFPPSSAACQLGFYKSAPGDQLCAKCPLHSHSESRAARVCRCDSSFYRAVQDPPSAACTRKYTPSCRGS